jgi:hypothetical protein
MPAARQGDDGQVGVQQRFYSRAASLDFSLGRSGILFLRSAFAIASCYWLIDLFSQFPNLSSVFEEGACGTP